MADGAAASPGPGDRPVDVDHFSRPAPGETGTMGPVPACDAHIFEVWRGGNQRDQLATKNRKFRCCCTSILCCPLRYKKVHMRALLPCRLQISAEDRTKEKSCHCGGSFGAAANGAFSSYLGWANGIRKSPSLTR